jgi:hypothetical protein
LFYLVLLIAAVDATRDLYRGVTPWLLSFLLIAAIAVYGFRVKQYIISPDQLLISRSFGTKKIDLAQVSSVACIDYADLGVRIKLFGSGGVWGLNGYYYTRRQGVLFFNATDTANTLVLLTLRNNRKYVISPADANGFAADIASRIT